MSLRAEISSTEGAIAQLELDMKRDEDAGELNEVKKSAYLRAISAERDRIVLLRSL